jgi:signal transduction histidine kinase
MMNIFWIVVEILASAFENIVIMWVMGKFLNHRFNGAKKAVFFVGFLTLTIALITLINNQIMFEGAYAFIPVFIVFLYGCFALEGKLLLKAVITIMSLCLIFLINISVSLLTTYIFGIENEVFLTENDELRLLALFLTKFIFAVVAVIAVKLAGKSSFTLRRTELLTSVVVFITTMIIGFNAIELQMKYNRQGDLSLSLIIGIIFINIFVIYMFRVMTKGNERELENSLLRIQLSEQKAMIEDAGSISTEIKQAEHDVKHHILSALTLLENNNAEQAEVYLRKLYGSYEANVFRYITIDNSVINGILNFKIGRCHKSGIDIKCDIRGDFEPFDEMDLCIILCNLLDNAIESALKTTDPKIILTIKNNDSYLCILVKNHIKKSVLAENKNLKTTKSNGKKHGVGIYSVNQIVEKYDGILNFSEDGGYFIADAWLKFQKRNITEVLKNEMELMKTE